MPSAKQMLESQTSFLSAVPDDFCSCTANWTEAAAAESAWTELVPAANIAAIDAAVAVQFPDVHRYDTSGGGGDGGGWDAGDGGGGDGGGGDGGGDGGGGGGDGGGGGGD